MSIWDGRHTSVLDRVLRPLLGARRRIRSMLSVRVGMAVAIVTGLVAATGLAFAAGALVTPAAVLPTLPSSTQFDVTGMLQEATLDSACVAAAGAGLDAQGNPQVAHCGGTMKLNGQTIVVPNETIVILPASALTWQELFAQSPAPYTGAATGMALADVPKPFTTYEIHAVGNRVVDPTNSDPTKRDRYIAGLVHVSQQELNAGAGYINAMDYSTGEMRVGGLMSDPTTGARVRINDPATSTSGSGGRFGRAMSPDGRFMVDQDNPTIASGTGFPMCFPRTDPFVATDPLCPQTNRPIIPATGAFSTLFTMNNPATIPVGGASDPRLQSPFEVGDYVNYSGTLIADPLPGDSGSAYVSAHTIIANVAIYTFPGTNPAYVSIEVGLMGTGGLTIFGATEAAVRTRFEGMTTDPTRGIHLYGVDVLPDGSTSDRDWGTIAPDVVGGAVPGRWRFRPPCLAFGSGVPAKPTKDCVYGPGNGFLPPTREVRAVIEGLHGQIPGPAATTAANGIYYGQYHAPIGEYIFPENVPGQPIPENNFNTIPFLAPGGYSSFTGVVAGQLDPWPSNIVPSAPCVAPVANAGGPYTVASGGTVTLSATSSGSTSTFAWAPLAALSGTLSNLSIANPIYTAPVTSTTKVVNVSVTATNACGTNTSATKTITISPALAPIVDPIAAQAVFSGNPGDAGAFAVTATDPNVPPSQPLTWTVTQTGTPALLNLAIAANGPTGANVTYTAPSSVVAPPKVVTLTITARNPALLSSAPVTTTVTINPLSAAVPPVADAGGPYSVGSGGTVTLAASATGTSPLTFLWTAPAKGSLSKLNVANPVFTAPSVATTTVVTVPLTVTQRIGGVTLTSTANAQVTVNAALSPTVSPIAAQSAFSGAAGAQFTVTGADPNTPAQLPLTFAVSQSPAVLTNVVVTQLTPTSARVNYNAPLLAAGQITPTVVQLTITATNPVGLVSAPQPVAVTVKPVPDFVAITSAVFRTGKQRLVVTATSSVISANVVLTLQPYLTTSGATYDPARLGNTLANGLNGLYTLTLVGAPQPAAGQVLIVKSNLGGVSPAHALDLVRA